MYEKNFEKAVQEKNAIPGKNYADYSTTSGCTVKVEKKQVLDAIFKYGIPEEIILEEQLANS